MIIADATLKKRRNINRIKVEFKDENLVKLEWQTAYINRIKVEFKADRV